MSLSDSLHRRPSLSAPPSPTHTSRLVSHSHSLSEDFDVYSHTISHLSLVYNQHKSHSPKLSSCDRENTSVRPLRAQESAYLSLDDGLFADAQPVDKIVRISGIGDSPDLSSEVISRSSQLSSQKPVLGVWELPSMTVKGVVFAWMMKKEWKRRFVVFTDCCIRLFRNPTTWSILDLPWARVKMVNIWKREVISNKWIVRIELMDNQEVFLRVESFVEAQSSVVLARTLMHRQSIPKKLNRSSDPLQWLANLYNQPSNSILLKEEMRYIRPDWVESPSTIPNENFVVCFDSVMSVESYLLGNPKCDVIAESSIVTVVKKIQASMTEEYFQRLVQISALQYPSPDSLLFTVISRENEDWGVLFTRNPEAFKQALQRSELFRRSSLSCRSFKWSFVCCK